MFGIYLYYKAYSLFIWNSRVTEGPVVLFAKSGNLSHLSELKKTQKLGAYLEEFEFKFFLKLLDVKCRL